MQKPTLYLSLLLNVLFVIAFFYLVKVLGGWNYLLYRVNHRGISSEYEHRKSLYEMMPIREGDILFLGNSLTAQCDWADLLADARIKNRGIPGDTSDGILERIDELLKAKPAQLFLMIGVNDLLFSDPEQVIDNYQRIIARVEALAPTTQLLLYSILPVNPELRHIPINNASIRKINGAIQKMAAAKNLIYIDLYEKFANKDGFLFAKFTTDGIHLNGYGYQLWKESIKSYIKPDTTNTFTQ